MFLQFQELDHFVKHFQEKLTLGIKLTFEFTTINYQPTSTLPLTLVQWKIIAGYAHFNWTWIVILILVRLSDPFIPNLRLSVTNSPDGHPVMGIGTP